MPGSTAEKVAARESSSGRVFRTALSPERCSSGSSVVWMVSPSFSSCSWVRPRVWIRYFWTKSQTYGPTLASTQPRRGAGAGASPSGAAIAASRSAGVM